MHIDYGTVIQSDYEGATKQGVGNITCTGDDGTVTLSVVVDSTPLKNGTSADVNISGSNDTNTVSVKNGIPSQFNVTTTLHALPDRSLQGECCIVIYMRLNIFQEQDPWHEYKNTALNSEHKNK